MPEQGVVRVADLGEGQPTGGHHGELVRPVQLVAQPRGIRHLELALPHRDAHADEGTHHAVAERVGADVGDEHAVRRRGSS